MSQDATSQPPGGVRVDASAVDLWFAALSSAERVRQFSPSMVPGPLQTPECAVATILAFNVPPVSRAVAERIYAWRSRRRPGVGPAGVESAEFVVAEGVLRQRFGGPEVMDAQLRHLAVMEPRVASLRVLPASAGVVPGTLAPFVLLDCPTGGALFQEFAPGHEHLTQDPSLVAAYQAAWGGIAAASVPLGEWLAG